MPSRPLPPSIGLPPLTTTQHKHRPRRRGPGRRLVPLAPAPEVPLHGGRRLPPGLPLDLENVRAAVSSHPSGRVPRSGRCHWPQQGRPHPPLHSTPLHSARRIPTAARSNHLETVHPLRVPPCTHPRTHTHASTHTSGRRCTFFSSDAAKLDCARASWYRWRIGPHSQTESVPRAGLRPPREAGHAFGPPPRGGPEEDAFRFLAAAANMIVDLIESKVTGERPVGPGPLAARPSFRCVGSVASAMVAWATRPQHPHPTSTHTHTV